MPTPDGRTRHYGEFYAIPEFAHRRLGVTRPLILVWGNCQAEAVRVLLSRSPSLVFDTIRIPPVFELTAADIDPLRAIAARAHMLLTQPVRDDYRDLPLGSRQVRAMMPDDAIVIRWPVLRYNGFHPYQAIVRDPAGLIGDPPVVPYHDLRTLAHAATGIDVTEVEPPVGAYRDLARASLQELARRERADCDVSISDFLQSSTSVDMFTINHPRNRVLIELTRRLQTALDTAPDAAEPGRDLLGEVRAPADRRAMAALGLNSPPAVDWSVRGVTVSPADVHTAQLAWYRQNPAIVRAGLTRHQNAMATLGLGTVG